MAPADDLSGIDHHSPHRNFACGVGFQSLFQRLAHKGIVLHERIIEETEGDARKRQKTGALSLL